MSAYLDALERRDVSAMVALTYPTTIGAEADAAAKIERDGGQRISARNVSYFFNDVGPPLAAEATVTGTREDGQPYRDVLTIGRTMQQERWYLALGHEPLDTDPGRPAPASVSSPGR